jgi:TM2 domain-containing membrane protein YozV/ribosomal protein L40E
MNDTAQLSSAEDSKKAADQKFCFSCGAVLHASATGCPKCGAVQPSLQNVVTTTYQPVSLADTGRQLPHHVFCRGCSASIHETAAACPKCGAPQAGIVARSGKNRMVAAVLAFFLGGFGAHKFYVGHIGQGILYLVSCWTGLPALAGIIEGIVYLTMSDQEFARRYS